LPCPRRGRPARGDRRPGSAQDPRELLAPGPRGQRGVGSALPEDPGGGIQAEASPVRRIVVGVSGASGGVYGLRLLERPRGEGGPLSPLVRETPRDARHLRMLTQLAEMGAVILPPMPAFYHRPKQIEDLVDHTLARVLDRLQIPQALIGEWQGTNRRPPRE